MEVGIEGIHLILLTCYNLIYKKNYKILNFVNKILSSYIYINSIDNVLSTLTLKWIDFYRNKRTKQPSLYSYPTNFVGPRCHKPGEHGKREH